MVPLAFPFLNNIRKLYNGTKPLHSARHIRQHHREDAKIMQRMLNRIHAGIDMHKRVDCFPDLICLADSCPSGMVGYSVTSGIAWHYDFPSDANFTNKTMLWNFSLKE
jgi:hypothetical protein